MSARARPARARRDRSVTHPRTKAFALADERQCEVRERREIARGPHRPARGYPRQETPVEALEQQFGRSRDARRSSLSRGRSRAGASRREQRRRDTAPRRRRRESEAAGAAALRFAPRDPASETNRPEPRIHAICVLACAVCDPLDHVPRGLHLVDGPGGKPGRRPIDCNGPDPRKSEVIARQFVHCAHDRECRPLLAARRVGGLRGEETDMGLIRGLRFRACCVAVAALAVGLAVVASSAAAPPTPPAVKQKEAEARQILAQVNALDNQSDRTVEAWVGAKYELSQIKKQEAHNKVLLRWARHGYRIAEQRAEARLVALYESENPSAIDAIFGATNLNDILDRLETIHATTALDRHLVQQVESKREVLAKREVAIENARVRQAQAVLELSQRKAQIEAQLAKRKRLLASVQGEVQQLKAQEAARQAKLIAEAKARLAAAQAAAVARAKAAAKARARAEAQAQAQAAAAAAAAARARRQRQRLRPPPRRPPPRRPRRRRQPIRPRPSRPPRRTRTTSRRRSTWSPLSGIRRRPRSPCSTSGCRMCGAVPHPPPASTAQGS